MISLPLVDSFSRRVSYLRVSLTDRCNYRCQYCMPKEGVELVPKPDLLTFDEIERIVRALMEVGVRRVRLTGGEPTVRRDLVTLVERLAALGLDDLAMTTNGQLLRELARPLKQAGLSRLNVSVDTLSPLKFHALTRRGDLSAVLDGIEAAREAGFVGTKLNAVVLGGANDDNIPALCRYAWERDLLPRFIEFMPMSDGALFKPGEFHPVARMRERVTAAYGALENADSVGVSGAGPARYQRVATGPFAGCHVGFIAAVSEPFCETCNRVRLSAVGQLHTCLALDDAEDLRGPLRTGCTDGQLLERVWAAVTQKRSGHGFTSCGAGAPRKHMVAIGG